MVYVMLLLFLLVNHGVLRCLAEVCQHPWRFYVVNWDQPWGSSLPEVCYDYMKAVFYWNVSWRFDNHSSDFGGFNWLWVFHWNFGAHY